MLKNPSGAEKFWRIFKSDRLLDGFHAARSRGV
jgi:hypothetical protein